MQSLNLNPGSFYAIRRTISRWIVQYCLFSLSVGHLNPYRRCSVAFYFFIFLFFKAFDVLSSVKPAVQFICFCCLLAVSADVSRCFRVSADPEEDDAEVPHEGLHQHAQPLPLPVRLSPAGMDGLPLQHALLHRLHGTGIQNQCKLMIKGGEKNISAKP